MSNQVGPVNAVRFVNFDVKTSSVKRAINGCILRTGSRLEQGQLSDQVTFPERLDRIHDLIFQELCSKGKLYEATLLDIGIGKKTE